MLRYANVMRAENNRAAKNVIAYSDKVLVNDMPCIAVIMCSEVSYVFKQSIFWTSLLHNSLDIKEKRSFGFVLKSQSFSSF